MTLRESINEIEYTSDELVIFATKQDGDWKLDAPAALIWLSDVETIGTSLEDLHYFLEVEIAKEVLVVWRQWRNGRIPTETERAEALIYYAENDAYLEVV